MSAYIVDPAHINALVSWASGHGCLISYFWQGARRPVNGDEDRIASVLYAENVRSVNYRYSDSEPAHGHVYRPELPRTRTRTPVEILKAVNGYEYQACECEDWEQSEAFAICSAFKEHAIRALPGYDAAPWEIRAEQRAA